MTCKDCVHYDLCRSCSRIQLGWHGNSVRYVENIEEICKDFKDCARFVELPCKVGDTIYRLKDDKVIKEQVVEFGISSYGVVLYRTLGYELGYSDYFGNYLFLTKEEAEQALKLKTGDTNA